MPDLTLLSILAVTITAFFSGTWATKVTNDRCDEILSGVVKGIPVSTKQRRLMLTNNWLPHVAFLVVFLVIIGIGVVQLARGTEDPVVRLVGYMTATLCAGAGAFWIFLGASWFLYCLSVLRETKRD